MKKQFKTHLKMGDKIKVITGNQKGLIGNISFINKKKETVGMETLLPRVTYKKNPQGGEAKKVEIQGMIHISNVMLWDAEAKVSSTIGIKIIDGQKKRYFKKSGNII